MTRVITAEKLTERHTAYLIDAPEVATAATPGQLLMARLGDQVRFTPHAIADFDRDKGTVTIVRAAPANGTEPTVEKKNPDPADIKLDVNGPMGKTPDRCPQGKILCVADGMGVAALHTRLREYKENGCYTIVIAGYPSKNLVYWQDRLNGFADEFYVVTEDGSFGVRGPIQQTVRAVCRHVTDIERALAVGPMPFLKACANATRNYEIPTFISLNAVVDHEDDLASGEGSTGSDEKTPTGKKPEPFDWHNASDLDGHTADFDKLTEQLGIPPAK